MQLNVFDCGRWGPQLARVARARGWTAHLFTEPFDLLPDAPVFFRIPEVRGIHKAKCDYQAILGAGWRMIPDPIQAQLYEDKVAQALAFPEFMPRTVLAFDRDTAMREADNPMPVVSKAAEGSASRNVRLLSSPEEKRLDVRNAFGQGIRVGGSRGIQKGYVLWQEYLDGNAYDYRVIANGRHRMVLRRWNRKDKPFASGSGNFDPITECTEEIDEVLDAADEYFRAARTRWCGVDMVRHPGTGLWMVLESTIAWGLPSYAGCRYFDAGGVPTDYFGAHQWELLLDNIEFGLMGC